MKKRMTLVASALLYNETEAMLIKTGFLKANAQHAAKKAHKGEITW
ncbi:hypothetical protein [Marinomonas posidonica]|uniref:Uncharacterized protein n=1 Tax=Marinomonas posidonica (strain CECT 7376 / NCIMB 14433 / IVIA-Po-181) TaxID=491952 RepID=F6CU13_MARPP|nr:hypothetical protein [Marinomonas posidonica]AEF54065.1 hypothetical protein Mar181_1016 [Marinomonas posidonica IVIA-Po-181]